MSKNWVPYFMAATLAVGLLSGPGFAQSGQGSASEKQDAAAVSGGRAHPGRAGLRKGVEGRRGELGALRALRDPAMRERLGLDAAQSERLDAIFFESAQKAIQLGAELKSLRLEMFRRLREENPDRAALEAKIDEIAAVRTNMARLRLDAFFEIRDLLTPEQRQLFRQTLQERRGRGRNQGRRGDQRGPAR